MSSTSSSWRTIGFPVFGCGEPSARSVARGDAARRPRRTRPGCGAPTRAGARCTSRARSRASRGRPWPSARARSAARRSSPPRSPARRAAPCFTNHCSLIERLDHALAAVGDRRRCARSSSTLLEQPELLERLDAPPSRAFSRGRPANGPPFSLSVPSFVEDVDDRQLVARAALVVGRVVAGRDLDRAGAERRLDASRRRRSGSRARRSGSTTRRADQVAVALVLGVHGDAGVAEHRLGPRGRDGRRRAPGARPRPGSGCSRACPCARPSRSRRRRRPSASTQSQLTRRAPR